jgi:AcrR family transcriptional regulator
MNRDSLHRTRTARSPLRDKLRQQTIEAILDATEVELAEEGVHNTKMNDIAARAGVSVGTLYNHFRDREELVRALFDARRASFWARLDAALAATARAPFARQLDAFVRAILEEFELHRPFLRIILETEYRPPVGPGKRPPMAQIIERAERVMKRGLAEKALRPELAELYPTVLFTSIKGTMHRLLREPDRHFPAEAERIIDLFLHGAAT